ncbi:MAG: exopolyphosphatase [Pseudomonadota bacterium]|nr:exopolyphosphatase [Pseudomonadota bacterium]
MSERKSFRLVTRSDFDGLVCAVLLKEMGLVGEIAFVHPKDMQDGKIAIGPNDIITNLPYVAGCHLAFDHHLSETLRLGSDRPANHIIDPNAPSAARVVYDHFGGAAQFPQIAPEMIVAVDKADSAQFSLEEILTPTDWVLLNYLMDARTGLGRFREFRVSNYQLMMQLIDYCRDHAIDEILSLPDVKERADLYHDHADLAEAQLRRCATVHTTLLVLDLRNEATIYATNRFMLYALNPACDISIHVMWGVKQQNTVFAIGKSIVNRGSKVNIGELCLKYDGGGHANAGTCQIANEDASRVLSELIAAITAVA